MTDMTSNQYMTAFFDSEADAEAAVARIAAEGIPRDQIRIVAGNAASDVEPDPLTAEPREKGFFGALADLFLPEEDQYAYAEGLGRGGFLVSLYVTPKNQDRILDILDDEGTVDMDARQESWRAEGWTGYQGSGQGTGIGATPVASSTLASGLGMPDEGIAKPQTGGMSASSTGTRSSTDTDMGTAGDEKIEVVEEKLRVGKRNAEGGRVRVRSYVVETPVEEEISLRDETVRLERTPVDRPVGTGEAFVDRTLEATEKTEEAVVSKEARVTEEISLGKAVDTRTETVRDTVRKTEVEIDDERLDGKKDEPFGSKK